MKLKPLSDQVIVITGASSGIGLATAELAAAAGARLVLTARNGIALAAIAARLDSGGSRIVTCAADIADPDAAERIAATALDAFGRVDSWANIAAAAIYGELADVSEADHRRVFDVGYFGTVRASLKAVELLKANGGALINVGSILSERSIILQGTYSAMKHALLGFTETLRTEVEAAGWPIAVTLIKPAGMATPYPEHARNLTGSPKRIPPVVYDPRLSARAILFSAAHRRREITVGGTGLAIQLVETAFPRLTDFGIELLGRRVQEIDTPPPAEATDNLYEPRAGGRIETVQPITVRRTSLWLEAQLHPGTAALAVGAAALATIAGLRRRR